MDDNKIPYIAFEAEMSRKLREMMEDVPDEASRREIQRLADKMESM